MVESGLTTYWNDKNILLTGGTGFLGSHLLEKLISEKNIDPSEIKVPRSKKMDLRSWENCLKAVKDIDLVIHLAANVGGIGYNLEYPATLFYDNAIMGIQIMEASRQQGVQKFVTVGSVCAYPKYAPIPFKEEDLWKGYPEETNAPYGIAKKILLVQAQAYRQQYDFNAIYLLPVNLYGPRDNFHLESSHVIPALIKKMVHAKLHDEEKIVVWGTGQATREFLYVDDAVDGIILATERYNKPEPVNLGSGIEISIKDLVALIAKFVGFKGSIQWDRSKPDGQPRRCLDVSKARSEFGFNAQTDIMEGLKKTIEWYTFTHI